jgi:hypothetical protein
MVGCMESHIVQEFCGRGREHAFAFSLQVPLELILVPAVHQPGQNVTL